jgi:hypothetical protein
VPGGLGHAVGIQNGVGIIKVFVTQITPEAVRVIPSQIDGTPFVLEAIGRVVAF